MEEKNKDKNMEALKVYLDHLEERVREALAAIQWAYQWAQDERRIKSAAEHDAYLLRVYAALQEAEAEARHQAKRRAMADFMVFVRAAAAARELEKLTAERRAGKGLAAGFADGLAESAAWRERDARQIQDQPDGWGVLPNPAHTAAWLARRRAERGEGGGGDDGGMGAGLELAKTPQDQLSTYEQLVAEHRAARLKIRPQVREAQDNDDSGPGGP